MTEEKKGIVGIVIPEECGSADMYEFTAIMYHDEKSVELEKEYMIFITEEDYDNNTPFVTIRANMNPNVFLYPDTEHEGMGCLEYDLVEAGLVRVYKDNVYAIIVSEVVNDSETTWKMSDADRKEYLSVTPKTIKDVDNELSIEE